MSLTENNGNQNNHLNVKLGVPVGREKVIHPAVTTRDVRMMYESYPYPSPVVSDDLIDDVANSLGFLYPDDPLVGKRILDAGCGTGQRLLGAAKRYPKAEFWGLDMTSASLDIAKQLANRHQIKNVHLIQADLLNLDVKQEFDLISSTGVIHHLENPALGLKNLSTLLAKDAVISIWLYHAFGEHQRLLDREILLTLWRQEQDNLEFGLSLLRKLQLRLGSKRYGTTAVQDHFEDINQTSIDVDAYMHPIVNAYRFAEALKLFDGCNIDWLTVNGINSNDYSKLLDLSEADNSDFKYFNLDIDELFKDETLKQRFQRLSKQEKLAIIELKLKPSGFTLIAGRGRSIYKLGPRVRGNILT